MKPLKSFLLIKLNNFKRKNKQKAQLFKAMVQKQRKLLVLTTTKIAGKRYLKFHQILPLDFQMEYRKVAIFWVSQLKF